MSTKTIDTTELRKNLAATLKSVSEDDIIFIKNRGKLTGKVLIDDELLEDLLLLKSVKYVAEIAKARDEIKKGEVYSFDEVFGDVI